MASSPSRRLPQPRRGEIWTAALGRDRQRHWILIVSLDPRNLTDRAETVLIVPFASRIVEAPTTLVLQPGETGLPGPSCLRAHFITTLPKTLLIARQPRSLSASRMREVSLLIRRSFDPDSPF
jgi:mRNA-degrading endonuclease toxin of MazEF toxin-antitoxin module